MYKESKASEASFGNHGYSTVPNRRVGMNLTPHSCRDAHLIYTFIRYRRVQWQYSFIETLWWLVKWLVWQVGQTWSLSEYWLESSWNLALTIRARRSVAANPNYWSLWSIRLSWDPQSNGLLKSFASRKVGQTVTCPLKTKCGSHKIQHRARLLCCSPKNLKKCFVQFWYYVEF